MDESSTVNASESSDPATTATAEGSEEKVVEHSLVDSGSPESMTDPTPLSTLAESRERAGDSPTHEIASPKTLDDGLRDFTKTTNESSPAQEEAVDAARVSDGNAFQTEPPQLTTPVSMDDSATNREEAVMNSASVLDAPPPQLPSVSCQERSATETSEPNSSALNESKRSRPLGFAASLTASFTPETKSAWAQLFGSRYEDEVECERSPLSASPESSQEKYSSSTKRTSLKSKMERERKLDKQIQASRQKFTDHSLHHDAASSTAPPSYQKNSPNRVTSTAPIAAKPFEVAGLSITSVRFCVEKALRATCKCFQQLHALAMNEPHMPNAEAELGVFISQWEMEQLLRDLFEGVRDDPKTLTSASSLSSFALADPLYAGVPLELLLQATWFVPFDQISRLRSLVLQITRKHLNEHKLAVLNRHLQKQVLLIPYSARLQQVLLRFSGSCTLQNDSEANTNDVATAPPRVHCSAKLVRELLECVGVPVSADLVRSLSDGDFLLLSPVRSDLELTA